MGLAEDLAKLAGQIEDAIYKSHDQQTSNDYKASLRSHVFNLKDPKNPLRKRILSGSVTPTTFARMSADDMASPELRLETEQLRRRSIVDSMGIDSMKPRHRAQDNPDEEK
ncbi:transcription factor S-II, central domain-containing protein [Dichotomocladium elegans]|nr:transcription factor S-II, central domain-containing protein [Dichotomocladium elegans]